VRVAEDFVQHECSLPGRSGKKSKKKKEKSQKRKGGEQGERGKSVARSSLDHEPLKKGKGSPTEKGKNPRVGDGGGAPRQEREIYQRGGPPFMPEKKHFSGKIAKENAGEKKLERKIPRRGVGLRATTAGYLARQRRGDPRSQDKRILT